MAREKLTTLESWAEALYGEHAPSIFTLRRWCREGRILPLPKKHGRTYFVSEGARYIDYNDPDYVKAIRESAAT